MFSINERKLHLQKDIVSLLESSFKKTNSNNKTQNHKDLRIKENMKRCASQDATNKYKIKSIQTELPSQSKESNGWNNKNEILLLEKILEKDDEIKKLRNRLDNFQNQQSNNLSHTYNYGMLYRIKI